MRAILPAAVVTAILGVAGWQTGCNPTPTFVSEDHFAAQYAQALCTSLQPCCSENAVAYDYQACAKGWQAFVENLLYGPTSTGNYNTAEATNCLAEIRAAQGASCQPVPGSLSDARNTCQAIFAGTAPLGAPCTSAAQCAPIDGSVVGCAVPAGESDDGGGGGGQLPLAFPALSPQGFNVSPQDVSVCVAESPPDGGAAASASPCSIHAEAGTDTCQAMGMYCDPKALTCTALSAAAGNCDPSVVSSCQSGNYCAPSGGGTGACIAAGPVGTPCTAAPMCDSTGFCDPGSHTCRAIEQAGQSCTSGLQCSIGVCDATTHTCLTNAIATTAACTGAITTQ